MSSVILVSYHMDGHTVLNTSILRACQSHVRSCQFRSQINVTINAINGESWLDILIAINH